MTTTSRTARAAALLAALVGAACSGGGSSPPPAGCTSPAECPGADTACSARTCVSGVCGTQFAPTGTVAADPAAGDCRASLCDGAGNAVPNAAHDADVPVDGNGCTADTCNAGTPANALLPLESPCTDGGGQVCDGAGACVPRCAVGNPCSSPPPPACAGDVATTYPGAGTCAIQAGDPGYACTYTPAQTDCAAAGLVCDAGACVTGLAATSAQLQAVHAAAAACASSPCAASLAVDRAVVTYARPAIGAEAAGFYLQASRAGPAILVEVDPAGLAGGLVAGDRVSLTVTGVALGGGGPVATAVSGVVRTGSGVDLAPLVQDVSAATDLVTAVDGYVHELVTVEGTTAGAAAGAGSGFVSFPLATAGVPASTPGLALRVAVSVLDAVDVASGCALRAGPAPLGRFGTVAQPTARAAAELELLSCPAPRLVSALATDAAHVTLTFDRLLDAASVAPDGSQVVFDNGLVAAAAAASGRELLVTTSAQAAGLTYSVVVAGTIADRIGRGVDPGAATATFAGWAARAALLLNELSPNVTGQRDLVELLVTSPGSTAGVQLVELGSSPVVLATLPDLPVEAGDLVVVHLGPLASPDAPASETVAKTQYPRATYAANYDTAWDVLGGAAGLVYSNRVIRVLDPAGATLDAAPFVTPVLAAPPSAFPANLQQLQAEGGWLPADCSGTPCTYTSTPSAVQVSVSWSAAGTSPAGDTVQRRGTDTRTAADWSVGPQSLGLANP